jgi:tetratricopeptide (TPR) repeat protein
MKFCNLREALRLSPKNAAAYYYRGCVYGGQGNYQSAIADFDQSLRLDPRQERVRAARRLAARKITEIGHRRVER